MESRRWPCYTSLCVYCVPLVVSMLTLYIQRSSRSRRLELLRTCTVTIATPLSNTHVLVRPISTILSGDALTVH